MLNKIDFKYLVLSILCLSVSFFTFAGVIQEHIHFADPLNEIGFAFISLFGSVLFGLGIKK